MPLITNVIDDKSPLILYDSTWLYGTSQDDPYGTDYYLGTFTTNNVTDGSATFDFNGTAIWVYGANRPNHGSYSVQVDNKTYSGYNGQGNNVFQQSLFNLSALGQGAHSLKLTNTGTGSFLYVDIDMIVWQSEVGNADDQLAIEVVQDTDSRFQYQEPGWDTSSSAINFGLFANGTGHVTGTYNASVTFTFIVGAILTDTLGDAVSIYGTSGPNNGLYLAQLDGGQTVSYNASNAYPTNYGVMIYHADNLGSGSHQLVLTNLPDSSAQSLLALDYAQLWTINSNSLVNSDSSSSTSALGSGAIAGIVIAVVAAVLGVGAAVFFYRRWKAALAIQHDHYTQRQATELVTIAPIGFSSSLQPRSNVPGGAQQSTNYISQYDGAVPGASVSRDSRSIIDTVSSPAQSTADETFGRRPLPDAPGGGLSLTTEFPKLSSSRPVRRMSADHSSIAASEVPPPNYIQAVGNTSSIPE